MKTAIYPLSADPITNGHLDIIKRASKIFDKVVVAIGNNSSKNYLFNIKEREEITRQVLKNHKNLEIVSFDCLLTDLAKQKNINFIVRGFRNSNDYLHELNLYQNYLSQDSNLDFINLFSSKEFISSTAIKEIANLHGQIHNQVPLLTKFKLEEKLHKQTIIGITGVFGSGKTNFTKFLEKEFSEKKQTKFLEKILNYFEIKTDFKQIHTIDFDKLTHTVLNKIEIREQIIKSLKLTEVFNFKTLHRVSPADFRKKLAKEVFVSKAKLSQLENILFPWIFLELRQELKNKQGVIFLETPLLIEKKLSYLCNNNVIIINSDKNFRYTNLLKNGFSQAEIENREKYQLTNHKKKLVLNKQIKLDNFGKILEIKNTAKGYAL